MSYWTKIQLYTVLYCSSIAQLTLTDIDASVDRYIHTFTYFSQSHNWHKRSSYWDLWLLTVQWGNANRKRMKDMYRKNITSKWDITLIFSWLQSTKDTSILKLILSLKWNNSIFKYKTKFFVYIFSSVFAYVTFTSFIHIRILIAQWQVQMGL